MEAFMLVCSALFFLVFWGSHAEGQRAFFEVFLSDQIVEKGISLGTFIHPANIQLADINSIIGTSSGRGGSSEQPKMTELAPTVQEGALIAYSPPYEDYLDTFEQQRSQVITYTVQEGDALSFIASDFGVAVTSILWANEIVDPDSISPGQELRIPPVNGVVHTVLRGETVGDVAEKYKVEAADIIAFNSLPASGALIEGDELIVPDGILPESARTTTTSSRRSFSYLPNLNDFFRQPTTGYNWGRIHGRNGVDVANSCGTPIVAAADGVVTVADGDGWNGGFGKNLKIQHDNGTETLYAHASRLLVGVDSIVSSGEHVALMGSTGRSTGCHLHFEVHGAQNPLAKY